MKLLCIVAYAKFNSIRSILESSRLLDFGEYQSTNRILPVCSTRTVSTSARSQVSFDTRVCITRNGKRISHLATLV